MQSFTSNPTFVAYAVTTLVLCGNLSYLWAKSGAVRGRSKTVMNHEDAGTFAKGAVVVPVDPPEVARVLRAHANAMAVTMPFLAIALLYLLAGGPAAPAQAVFGAFVLTRLVHSFAYLRELQPWRTISFVASGVIMLGLLAHVAWMIA